MDEDGYAKIFTSRILEKDGVYSIETITDEEEEWENIMDKLKEINLRWWQEQNNTNDYN